MKRVLLFLAVFAVGVASMFAASPVTLTITLNGSLALISGPDPLGGNGSSATATAAISESAVPKSHTANSATYLLPAGSVTARSVTAFPSAMDRLGRGR